MKRFVVLLVAIAVGVGVAAFVVPKSAATVNGQGISRTALNSDLTAIDASVDYQCYLVGESFVASSGQSFGPLPTGAGGQGTYSNLFAQFWLNNMINAEVLDQLVASRGIAVTSQDLADAGVDYTNDLNTTLNQLAGSQLACSGDAQTVLASLPSDFVTTQIRVQADFEALIESLPGGGVTASDIAAYFAAHQSSFNTICVSGILVANQSTATQVLDQINAGTSFAQAAKQSSTDPTGANGGVLGCFKPGDANYAAYDQDLASTPVGGVTQPIQGGSGYVLFQLTSSTPNTLADEQSYVRQAILGAGSTGSVAAGKLLAAATRRATVTVDPRYGRWLAGSAASGLYAPKSPPASTLLSPTADKPRS
jgi:parvulin-like peptidyl-prolyl isomerase